MSLKKNEMQITENHLFATHNLEVPGSSPGWSTFFRGEERRRSLRVPAAFVVFYPP